MNRLMNTKEVARHLGVNEKMVYTLVAEKGLPASKVTGKWIFPQHLVDQWVEAHTINLMPGQGAIAAPDGLLIIAGSNDPLMEQAIGLYNTTYPDHLAVFGNIGSMGGIRALKQDLCHIASSHLLEDAQDDYNFETIAQHFTPMPAVVNFCRRHQGLIVARGNPRNIHQAADLNQPGLRIINRKLGTGTRQLFDYELKKAGIEGTPIDGYADEAQSHMDIGLAILAGKADAGPAIQPIAELLHLDFVPWRWERYDLLIHKERFFNPAVQHFLGLLHEEAFQKLAAGFRGYDTATSGKMIYRRPASTLPTGLEPIAKEES